MNEVVSSPHIPHFEVRTIMEVGAVVGLFVLAMGCMACSLNGTRGCEGFCSRLTFWKCWRKIAFWRETSGDNDNDSDDESSYIDDAESGQRPAPHIFESINDLIFFERPREESMLSTSEDSGSLLPTSTDKIFPDLLAPSTGDEENPESSDLREPLL